MNNKLIVGATYTAYISPTHKWENVVFLGYTKDKIKVKSSNGRIYEDFDSIDNTTKYVLIKYDDYHYFTDCKCSRTRLKL